MANPDSEERIRDLEERMTAMPGSRIFVGLAEEYRRAGRYEDALNTLQRGLEAHPTYLSARIALARLYQETWRTQEAIEAFSKVLAMDRENLVAAKALSELYENSRNPVEAIKKLKLYRAISGDKSIDEKIGRMEKLIHGEPPEPGLAAAEAAPPVEPLPAPAAADLHIPASLEPAFDPNQTVSIGIAQYAAPGVPSPPALPLALSLEGEGGTPERSGGEPGEGVPPAAAEEIPLSRTLADLYYKQGFVADAKEIYEKLAVANPMDESVTRRLRVLRNPSRQKAAKLEHWLARIQFRARAGRA